MNWKLVNSKLAIVAVTSSVVFLSQSINTLAAELNALVVKDVSPVVEEKLEIEYIITTTLDYEPVDEFTEYVEQLKAEAVENENIGFAEMEDYVLIRSQPNGECQWLGKLYPFNVVEILDIGYEWTGIKSGNVEGYVPTDCLVLGQEANHRMEETLRHQLIVDVGTLNVRNGPGIHFHRIHQVHQDDVFTVAGKEEEGWYPILYDQDIYYVCGEYVTINSSYSYAESKEEEEKRLEEEQLALEVANSLGTQIAEYALQFVGNPYVWGGTNLQTGADCSGFVQSVYKQFGFSLPRTSSQQRTAGISVSYSDIEIGDIVCYEGHVGIYIGENKIVNAINSKKGIGISSATYKSVLSVRRVY